MPSKRAGCSGSGKLTFLNQQATAGAMPASIVVDEDKKLLFTANHGFFDHVVKVVQAADGKWVLRSFSDNPESSLSDAKDVYDIRSASKAVALDGTRYDTW